jgi:hypothetical protein
MTYRKRTQGAGTMGRERLYQLTEWPELSEQGAGTMTYTISGIVNGKHISMDTTDKKMAEGAFKLGYTNPDTERVFLSDGSKQLAAYVRGRSLMFWSETLQMMVSVPDS